MDGELLSSLWGPPLIPWCCCRVPYVARHQASLHSSSSLCEHALLSLLPGGPEGQKWLWGASRASCLLAPLSFIQVTWRGSTWVLPRVSFPAVVCFPSFIWSASKASTTLLRLGRDQNAGGLHVGSPPIHPTRLCLEQRVLGFPAACAALSSGDILYVVLRAGTAALLCNGLICNSLTYASYNDTLGFGKTALLIYMGENTPDDCYERDLRYLI